MLAFGLRFTFDIFTKLFYLALTPFGWTWWLAVVFDMAFTLVSLSGVLEQMRLKLSNMCRRRCGRMHDDPCCAKVMGVLHTSERLEGYRLYRSERVRHWTPANQRKLR